MQQEQDALAYSKLMFQVHTPDFDDCYKEGYELAQNGTDDSENPYPVSSREHRFWQEGWMAGMYEEEPIFNTAPETVQNSAPQLTVKSNKYSWSEHIFKLGVGLFAAVAVYQVADMMA